MAMTRFCSFTGYCKEDCGYSMCKIFKGGVDFIMGPGGDEGTRQCTCHQYPHTDECVAPAAGEKE